MFNFSLAKNVFSCFVSIISGGHSYTAHKMTIYTLSNLKHLKAYASLNDSVNCSKLGETMS